MALILSLETSTTVCSVAFHNDGKLLDSVFIQEPRVVSARLLVEAENLLIRNSIKPSDLSAVAISSGPGSYTGLRIGTSAAKGLCYALNLPLIAVNSLLVLAQGVINKYESNLYCPMLDARRMVVYTMMVNASLKNIEPVEAKILTTESYKEILESDKVVFFGDGSNKFRLLTNHPNAFFVEGEQPMASVLGFLAYEKYLINDFEEVALFEPVYLKDFVTRKPVNIN